MHTSPFDLVLTETGVRFMGRKIPATHGFGGIRKNKIEGDGATPVGTHHIIEAFFRPDRIPQPMTWAKPIRPGDLWCDAPDHEQYNSLVRAPFDHSHEMMRRADPMYDIVLVTDWNYPHAQSGKGSAIFLHQWRGRCRPTAGCVAFSRADLIWICQRLDSGTRLIVPHLPSAV